MSYGHIFSMFFFQFITLSFQIDLLTPKQNGTVENTDQDKSAASIKGMWKKAFKSLKSSSSSDSKLVSYAIKNMYRRNIPTFIS